MIAIFIALLVVGVIWRVRNNAALTRRHHYVHCSKSITGRVRNNDTTR